MHFKRNNHISYDSSQKFFFVLPFLRKSGYFWVPISSSSYNLEKFIRFHSAPK